MTTTLCVIIGIVLGIVISIPIIFLTVYEAAKNDRQLTFVDTGSIKFRKFGETIDHAYVNVPYTEYDEEHDEIIDLRDFIGPRLPSHHTHGRLAQIFGKWFKDYKKEQGIFYVSIFYPFYKIHTWHFVWPKLQAKTRKEGEASVLEKYQIVQGDETVSSLFYEFAYPIETTEIELKGNFKINFTIRVILTVKKPLYLIGILKGKFMPQVVQEISGMLDNHLKDFDIDTFQKEDKRALVSKILEKGSPILKGAFIITDASYISFDYVGDSVKVTDAITAKTVAEREGDARIAKEQKDAAAALETAKKTITLAKADAKAKKLKATAAGFEIKKNLEAIGTSEYGARALEVWADRDARIRVAEEQRAAAGEFQGSTLMFGGAQPLVMTGGTDPQKGSDAKKNKPETEGTK